MKTMKETIRSVPKINLYFPDWCHGHGDEMRVTKFNNMSDFSIVISGSAAKITITKAEAKYTDAKGWFVDWEVIQFRPYDGVVRGRRLFDDGELAAAFGLTNNSGDHG
jgi:hypothetical protein